MHYDSTLNGIYKNDPVMKKIDGVNQYSLIPVNTKMSALDIQTLNQMYPCYEGCDQCDPCDPCVSDVDQGKICFKIISTSLYGC